jgi:protein gp37
MGETNIGWADHTINWYTWDCTRVSPGCKNCYMMAMANRYGRPLVGQPQWRGAKAEQELRRVPSDSVVFVNSMSDTYHENVPEQWIHLIHNTARHRLDVIFLILTKRVERLAGLSPMLAFPSNLWVGTSVESPDYLWRLEYLRRVPAAGRFVSFEPLLAPIPDVDLSGFRWAIVGGESGSNRRPFERWWADDLRRICGAQGVSFFYKQGSAFKPGQDRLLNGKEYNEYPEEWGILNKHERL